MPVHDYVCEPCKILVPDQYHPSHLALLACPDCTFVMERAWGYRAPAGTFPAYQVVIDGRPVEIRSLHDIRRIEQESLKGRAPIVFRAFSQDSSNMDVNTLGRREPHKFPTRSKSGIPFIVRKSTEEPS